MKLPREFIMLISLQLFIIRLAIDDVDYFEIDEFLGCNFVFCKVSILTTLLPSKEATLRK